MSYPDLSGKTAIVTGGGQGIGKALCLGLAQAGAAVIVAARSEKRVRAVAQEIEAAGGKALAKPTDLTKPEDIDALVKSATDTFGGVHILINNAARNFLRPLLDLRPDGFDKIFDVNVKAPFLLSRSVAPVMSGLGGGAIVNITTVGAERGSPMMGVYYASKAALKMLTMCMAVEWAPMNVRVNAIGPGMTKTEFSAPIWTNPEMERMLVSRIPQGRLAEPTDMVGAALFLCSEAAAHITGQTLYVDGGFLANG